ncbi:MAG: phosphate ABC transporter permease subunit PstC [Thermoplasmatota archaeon]
MTARPGDRILRAATGLAALVVVAAFLGLVLLLAQGSLPVWRSFGWRFVTGRDWNSNPPQAPGDPPETYGALPFIFGTLASSLGALVIAVPVAIGTAVALSEILPRWLSSPIGLVVELLAAVPSIVFGVWGLAILVPFVAHLGQALHQRTSGTSILAASLVLAAMVLPILTAVARDMLAAVAKAQKEAAFALGATHWEVTWRVVIPAARNGLVAAALLALGRAVGETMAVIFLIGSVIPNPRLPFDWNLFHSGASVAGTIANEFGEASTNALQRSALLGLGLLLLLMTLALNLAARQATRRLARGMGGSP